MDAVGLLVGRSSPVAGGLRAIDAESGGVPFAAGLVGAQPTGPKAKHDKFATGLEQWAAFFTALLLPPAEVAVAEFAVKAPAEGQAADQGRQADPQALGAWRIEGAAGNLMARHLGTSATVAAKIGPAQFGAGHATQLPIAQLPISQLQNADGSTSTAIESAATSNGGSKLASTLVNGESELAALPEFIAPSPDAVTPPAIESPPPSSQPLARITAQAAANLSPSTQLTADATLTVESSQRNQPLDASAGTEANNAATQETLTGDASGQQSPQSPSSEGDSRESRPAPQVSSAISSLGGNGVVFAEQMDASIASRPDRASARQPAEMQGGPRTVSIAEPMQIRQAVEGGARMFRVQLDPPELGRVWIVVREQRDVLTARIVAANEVIRQALDGQIEQLRAILHSAGVQVQGVEAVAPSLPHILPIGEVRRAGTTEPKPAKRREPATAEPAAHTPRQAIDIRV